MGWRTRKDGRHYNTDKKVREVSDDDVDAETSSNVNEKELEEFAKAKSEDFESDGIEVTNVNWWDAENAGVRYDVDKYGDVYFKNGFESVLHDLGADELSDSEIKELLEYESSEGNTDVTIDDWEKDKEQAKYDFLNEKEDNNTYNFSAALQKHLNFGFWELGDKTYFIFKEHSGHGDIRGNYDDNRIYDISNIDTGVTGEPKGDLSLLLNPEFSVDFKYKGEKYSIRKDGGANGFYDLESSDGGYDSDLEKEIGGEFDKNFYNAFEKYAEKEFK